MYAQESYNSQSGQGARVTGLPPYQQLPLPPPPRHSHNFEENNQVALRPGQPGMPLLQHGPQVPQFQRPYAHAPPGAHGSFMPPHMYNPSQQNLQQNYGLAPGILASRPASLAVSNSLDAMNVPLSAKGLLPAPSKGLLPSPSPDKMMYGASVHQLPLQKPGILQAPQNNSPSPMPPPSAASGNFQISCLAPLPPSSSLPKPTEANTVRKIDDSLSVQDCVATGSNSFSDSDMEMEDDITQPDNDHAINHSMEDQNNTYGVVGYVFDVKGELPASQNSADSHAPLVALPDKVLVSGSSGSGEKGTSGRVTSELRGHVAISAEAAECPSANKNKDITNTAFDDKEPQRTPSASDSINSFGQVIESGNLSRHNQNHVFDKTSGNDADLGQKEACSQIKSSLVVGCAEKLIKSSETSSGSESAHKTKKDSAEESELIISQGTHESLPDTQKVVKETVSTSITSGSTGSSKDKDHTSGCATPPKDFPKGNASGNALINIVSSGKSQKEKNDSTAQRIDKYGRLVREGVTDSDSDDSRHVHRNKRRKSRSRSRSPVDKRRRSSRRRRGNRSRSRSWSPVHKRSRSRSPSFKHAGKFSSGNMRRDKGQLSDCFDFLRGRCYRGASCRYLHHGSEKIDGSRGDRDKLHISSKNLNTREDSKKLSNHEISQQMKLSNKGSLIGPDSVCGSTGISSSCRYTVDNLDLNPPIQLAQYNSYEQPLGSRVSSDALRQEKDKVFSGKDDHSWDGRFDSVGSVNPTISTGQNVPGSGGDQYDPLLDSIEPLPNSSMKSDYIQKWEPSKDSDKVLRDEFRGFNKPLDVDENNQNEESSFGVAVTTSADNDEVGLREEAEVGNVENFSHGDDNAVGNVDDGEMEIDPVKSPGKTKKSKESRSMRLFKVALADFVKDVLKPSWRQGNMSKEAFKTVVKKTVDKVSGAMKSHQIPKSKAKIEQYINSSQRKLTKLVMGYVDKYAKG